MARQGPGQVLGPPGLGTALGQLGGGERAEQPQDVGDALGVLDPAVLGEPLQLVLQLGQDVGVEQLAQLGLAQELGQQPCVEGEGCGAALGERGVALVEKLRDIAEEQRAGEGGRLGGGHLHQPDPAGLDVAHQVGEARDVEDVLEAFADGFEDDREGTELTRHLKELGGALARCCHSGVRLPGSRRGNSSARAAHSRNREANSAEPPTWSVTIWLISPLSNATSAAPTGD
ncbi:hypothetical protein SANTM175S_04584 [Streptomyces antimycoticus]